MRGIIVFILAAAALVVGLLFLGRRSETEPGPAAAVAASPSPTPPPFTPTAAPVTLVPAQSAPALGLDPRFEQAARRTGVKIVGFRGAGAKDLIEVSWPSSVATTGVDFCDRLRREGLIRDFEPNGLRRAQADGRPVFIAGFELIY